MVIVAVVILYLFFMYFNAVVCHFYFCFVCVLILGFGGFCFKCAQLWCFLVFREIFSSFLRNLTEGHWNSTEILGIFGEWGFMCQWSFSPIFLFRTSFFISLFLYVSVSHLLWNIGKQRGTVARNKLFQESSLRML